MRKLALLAAVVCLVFCCGIDAQAQLYGAPVPGVYVGPSSGTTTGAAGGLPHMNSLCASYGSQAHMCTSAEFFQSAQFTAAQASELVGKGMWIEPSVHDCMYIAGKAVVCLVDGLYGLQEYFGAASVCADSSSFPWSSATGNGTIVSHVSSSAGIALGHALCSGPAYPVACCGPPAITSESGQ